VGLRNGEEEKSRGTRPGECHTVIVWRMHVDYSRMASGGH